MPDQALLEKISRVYAFVRSRSLNSILQGYTLDDYLNQEKERIKGASNNRMTKLDRLNKLKQDIDNIDDEASSK